MCHWQRRKSCAFFKASVLSSICSARDTSALTLNSAALIFLLLIWKPMDRKCLSSSLLELHLLIKPRHVQITRTVMLLDGRSPVSIAHRGFHPHYPNSRSSTIVTEFTAIKGTLITVRTDRIRFISCDLTPGSSPNPPIPWSAPQPILLRKRSSCSTAMAFTHNRAAWMREYRVKAMLTARRLNHRKVWRGTAGTESRARQNSTSNLTPGIFQPLPEFTART